MSFLAIKYMFGNIKGKGGNMSERKKEAEARYIGIVPNLTPNNTTITLGEHVM